jgi:hypothetical protein
MRTFNVDKASAGRAAPVGDDGIAEEIERLVKKHGDDADTVAARRADELFCKGDAAGGKRWLAIFRKLAMSHLQDE